MARMTHRLAALNGAALPCVKHETKTKHGDKDNDKDTRLLRLRSELLW